jgi:hypothetical protein
VKFERPGACFQVVWHSRVKDFIGCNRTPKTAPHPPLYIGYLLAALGGGGVLYYKPS